MGWRVTHAERLAVATLLACGGAALGMLASTMTSSAVSWRAPERFGDVEPQAVAVTVDQFSAGRGWARTAFDGGLRRCPSMNADFLAACEAEMKALEARPKFAAGSYGGPLLVTTYTPPEPAVETTAQSEPIPAAEPAVPASIQAAFEPTPENYPSEPQ